MSTIEYVYTVLFWFSFFFLMSHSIWVSHFFFRYTPAYTPLAIQELDEKHLGTFSFRTREGVLQVCL